MGWHQDVISNLWAVLLVTVIPLIHHLLVASWRGWLNVDGLFVLSQWVMASGTLAIVDLGTDLGQLAAMISTIPFVIYVTTSCILATTGRQHSTFYTDITVEPLEPKNHGGLVALFGLSVVITVAYFQAVGYNVLAIGLQGLATGTTNDYTTLRVESYSSSRYLFPGYVNQFKNTILPALAIVFMHSLFSLRHRWRRPITGFLVVCCIFALLGTGQRGAFVIFGFTVLVFLRHLDRKGFGRRAPLLAVGLVPLLVVVTLLLGRSSESMEAASGPIGKVGVVFKELGKRFFYDNQFSGYAALEYLQTQPTQWGHEWLQAVAGLLPSNPGSSLARDVFAFLYQSDRGTAPISMWGSVYYNWEWLGLVTFPVILALLFDKLTRLQHSKKRVNSLELVSAAGFAAVAGNWIAGGPEQLLNAGAVTYAILWIIGRRISRRAEERDPERMSSENLRSQPRVQRGRIHNRNDRISSSTITH